MKRISQVIGLLSICIFLWGCPYESKVPLGKPALPVDERLLGKWESEKPDEGYLVISKSSEKEYNIAVHEKGMTMDEIKGYVTLIKNVKFMNIHWTKSNETRYNFYKMELEGNWLRVVGISDSLKKEFNTAFELNAYVAKNMRSKSFFEQDALIFIRK